MRQEIRGCGICEEAMRGTSEGDVWLPDEEVAEVYDPEHPEEESVVCHVGCVPEGWETA